MSHRIAVAALILLLLAACGESSRGASGATTMPPSDDDLRSALVSWCQENEAGTCAFALTGVAGDPDAEWCLVDAVRCDSQTPVTTIPDSDTSSTTMPLPDPDAIDQANQRVLSILVEAHPGEPVEIAFVLAQPVSVDEAEGIAQDLGIEPRLAWLSEYLCIDMSGIDGWPGGSEPVREAPFDGAALVAERREAAERTPVTGAHIFEAGLERLLRSGVAMREPGTTVLAFSALVAPEDVPGLVVEDGVRTARVWQPTVLDLPDLEPPDCA